MKTVSKMAYSTSPCFWDIDQNKKLEPDIYIFKKNLNQKW